MQRIFVVYGDMMQSITMNELKKMPQWVGYTNQKIPMNPYSNSAAASNNPDTWGTAVQAWGAKIKFGWAGIGFVFTLESGIVGIDLDDCFIDGNLSDFAQQIVGIFDSYTEISPSGSGIHILVRGTIPNSLKTPTIEIYNELRYFTVTGNEYKSTRNIEPRQKELDAVFVSCGGDFEERPLPNVPASKPDITEGKVKKLLDALPGRGDYNTFWLPVLMAVHDAFPNERGVALCEGWSPGKKGEIRRKFRSFDRTAKRGIGIGTLFHMAKQNGWQPERVSYATASRNGDLRGRL